jgi:nicotinamide mononucleotide transporter
MLHLLYKNLMDTTWVEIVAVIFGLLSVWYAKKEKILVYPTGIINVLIYIYICYFAGLYADMGINAFYFIMSVYGWYNWSRKIDASHHVPISKATRVQLIISFGAFVIFFLLLWFVLAKFTDSVVPVWDSFTTSIFIVSMWLMALKKIENWIGWIIGDTLVIPLFAYKGLVFTSFQYIVFLALAISGYLEWRKKLKS